MRKELIIGLAICGLAMSGCTRRSPPASASGMLPPATGEYSGEVETRTGAAELQADLATVAGSDRVLFELDSSMLTTQARQILTRQIGWLRQNPGVSFTIEGHCDERGTREYNLALGDRRAIAVANFLTANGIAAGRLRTISYGKERPEAFGSDEAAYARNRRAVSIVITATSS
jgi:peptidoglycan-associated lipoprotein